ncbi:MAG TPA: DUF1974 domain-containing protein, partial [Casimicrobiaceae bacterium]
SDVSMGSLGGALKRKEKLSARLGDVLSLMYLCSATLKRYESEGRQTADAPLMHWAIWDAMFSAQTALEGVISNFPNRAIAALMRRIVFPLGRPYVIPSDMLGHEVARLLIEPSATRDRLTAGMYLSSDTGDPLNALERALAATIAAQPAETKIRTAMRDGRLSGALSPGSGVEALADKAIAAGVITPEEGSALTAAGVLMEKVIRVDDFAPDLGIALFQSADAAPARDAVALAPYEPSATRRRVVA